MKRIMGGLLGLLIMLALVMAIGQTTDAPPGTPPNSQAAYARLGLEEATSPAACTLSYTYTVSSGTISIADNLVAGSQCSGGCVVPLALPFPVTFYDQTYTSANVSTTGNLQFVTSDSSLESCPQPYAQLGPSMMPYWADGFDTSWSPPCQGSYGYDCGIFTKVTGSAPDRTLDIEWRARANGSNHETIDFEITFYETSDDFDFVYGGGIMFGNGTSIGVQNGASQYTGNICNLVGNYQYQTVHWTPQAPATCQPTQTATAVTTPTYTPTPTGTPPCAPAWAVSPHPFAGQGNSRFAGVAAIAADDVWAVGSYAGSNNYDQTLTEHWDGNAWTIVNSPNLGQYGSVLAGVAAIASDDVWAVGWYQTTGSYLQNLTMHWDGAQWSVVTSPTVGSNSVFNGVAAVATNDVWAVGYSGLVTYQTLAMHWDGLAWAVVSTPNLGTLSNALSGVAAVATNDVWAVGYADDLIHTLTIRWDGMVWSVVSSPSVGSDGSLLNGVVAISSTDVWAAGYSGSYASAFLTLTMRWDGTVWNVVSSPNPTTNNEFNAVGGLATGDVWAAGFDYDNTSGNTLTEHWDGTLWSVVPSADVASTNSLEAIAPVSATVVWAVGWDFNSGLFRTLIEHYTNACQPSPSPSVTPTETATVPPTPSYIPTDTPTLPPGASSTATDTPVASGTVTSTSTVAPASGTPTSVASASPTPTACDISFNDVLPGSTFYAYVHCLACLGIVQGYPDGSFRPNEDVTRGQASKILAESVGYTDSIPPLQQTFNDVPPGSTFWLYIERVTLHGAINGYPCGGPGEPCPGTYFRPQGTLTRGQASKIVSITAGYLDVIPPNQQTFSDVPPGSTFWEYIERVALHGVVSGYADGTFRPQDPATRGQLAKIATIAFLPGCGQ